MKRMVKKHTPVKAAYGAWSQSSRIDFTDNNGERHSYHLDFNNPIAIQQMFDELIGPDFSNQFATQLEEIVEEDERGWDFLFNLEKKCEDIGRQLKSICDKINDPKYADAVSDIRSIAYDLIEETRYFHQD